MMMQAKVSGGIIFPSVMMVSFGVVLAICNTVELVDDQITFTLLSVMLGLYLWAAIRQLRRYHPERWLLNPIVLCSFLTFFLAYSISNAVFFLSEDSLSLVGLVPDVTPSMVRLMELASVGAVAMWIGYWSPIAGHLCGPKSIAKFHARFLPKSNSLNSLVLPTLVLVALGSRLLQIELGVFGYSSSYDQLIEAAAYTQYLSLASGLGKLALVLASFQYFAPEVDQRSKKWFYVVLVVEVLFGFLSGFKSAVFMPFVIVAFCQYLRTGQSAKSWFVAAMIGLVVAYAVIEPFRDAKNQDRGFTGTSFSSIASLMINAAGTSPRVDRESVPFILAVVSRSNMSYIGSFAIEYADENPVLPAESPDFLQDLFLAPLHALIPRFIWSSKPLGDLGLWYNQVVLGKSHFSSTAMGPVAYLYFAGGFLAVFLGFFFLGIVQRGLFFLLQPAVSAPGGATFLAMLSTVVMIDSNFNGIIISLIRELLLVLLLQFFLYKRTMSQNNSTLGPSTSLMIGA
jgi:hypothetical protein